MFKLYLLDELFFVYGRLLWVLIVEEAEGEEIKDEVDDPLLLFDEGLSVKIIEGLGPKDKCDDNSVGNDFIWLSMDAIWKIKRIKKFNIL